MDFGRTTALPSVNDLPSHPELDPRTVELLSRRPRTTEPKLQIGSPVWGVKGWVGSVYPPATPQKDFLKAYSAQFSTVELNSSFYSIPEEKTMQGWAEQTPEGFTFCPKIFQGITHRHRLRAPGPLWDGMVSSLEALGTRLGTSIVQTSPGFEKRFFSSLEWTLDLVQGRVPLSFELRNTEWFENQKLDPRSFETLAAAGCDTVITDTLGEREVVHSSLTSPRVVIRFQGNGLHESDYGRIDAWVDRLGSWFEAGVAEVYFFIHQIEEEKAAPLISHMIIRANEKLGLSLEAPKSYEDEDRGGQLKLGLGE
jgi:uncharacterized protein YecE (DUF72 family)